MAKSTSQAFSRPRWERMIPHEYVVRNWRPDNEAVFERFVMAIREQGCDPSFAGASYRYVEIDGCKCWTMGDTLNEATISNRTQLGAKTQPRSPTTKGTP